ncbi:HEPN domain-containing protein [Desulfonema magnum]|uniref:HEPN domain-containing protein n=1 Tax=Desulfonema magnum TaxID=45655 RepID=A0A975GNW7_9BACT|nr:HEPN domain-containing protein [Desulfonema magnum]QTA87298.1 HEPN domain-containing protein [Desulfonema magnum]
MINEFFEKAQENLKAAQILFEQKLYNASANRAYYAAFQMAVARLASQGVKNEKNSHSWIQANFNGEFIQKHKIYPGRMRSYLPDLLSVRNRADYKSESLSRKAASRQLHKAEEFIRTVKKEFAP